MTTLTAATPAYGSHYLAGPAPRPATPTGGTLTGQDVIRALRQRLVMIILLWFMLTGATVGITLYMQSNYPVYSAAAIIRVESIRPTDPTDPLGQNAAMAKPDIERELQNQALVVRSPEVLLRALNQPEMKALRWFKDAQKEASDKNEKLDDLLRDVLSVSPIPETNYLQVSASWRIKTEVATIVNVVVQQYVAVSEERQKQEIGRQKEDITKEVERATKLLKNIKDQIDKFQTQNEFSEESRDAVHERVLTLESLVSELEIEMLGRKAQYENLQAARPEDLPITRELQARLDNDMALNALQQRYLGAEEVFKQVSERYLPNHRTVKDARMARDAAAQAFISDRASKIKDYQNAIIEQARRNFFEAQEAVMGLRDKLNLARTEQQDKNKKWIAYQSMLDEQEQLKLEYQSLLERKNMLEMIDRQKKTVQINIQSSATAPERMSSPQPSIWIPGGSFFGLLISMGFALLLEVMDKSVRTPRDVARAHLPVLGTIPTTDDDEIEIDRVETACLDAPHSVVAEAFRNLRANLFFSAPAEQQGVILVTSPSGGNGKTTVASNMAISIALSGRRVLLIDANFRRPSLPQIFTTARPEGLSNILVGQGELKDYVTPTNVPGLDVLSAGPLPPNPAELLGSSFLRDVVVDARSRYDQVIFDGPPVLLVSDAMVLAGAVDGVLLVCEYRSTSRGALQRTQSNLEAINVRIFGAVLNKIQSRAGGYFRKQYREFYEYHEPDADAPAPARIDAKSAAVATAATTAALPTDTRNLFGGGGGGAADTVAEAPTDTTAADQFESLDEIIEEDVIDEPASHLTEVAVDDEPPLAATIEESTSLADQVEQAFRDVGDTMTVEADSELIPDLSDLEDVDEFAMPPEAAWVAPPEPAPAQAETAVEPADEPVAETVLPEIEVPVAPAEPEVTPFEELAPPDAFEAPITPEEVTPGAMQVESSPFDLLEDEIDLGDDLADLDSEEFRIDDKFDLDDDFDDPNEQHPKR